MEMVGAQGSGGEDMSEPKTASEGSSRIPVEVDKWLSLSSIPRMREGLIAMVERAQKAACADAPERIARLEEERDLARNERDTLKAILAAMNEKAP